MIKSIKIVVIAMIVISVLLIILSAKDFALLNSRSYVSTIKEADNEEHNSLCIVRGENNEVEYVTLTIEKKHN